MLKRVDSARNRGEFDLIQKKGVIGVYFLAFSALVFGFGLAFAFWTGFIGTLQQIKLGSTQPQASSTKTTSPQLSHLYLSPFFFANSFTFRKYA
jgi:hypothetical protein